MTLKLHTMEVLTACRMRTYPIHTSTDPILQLNFTLFLIIGDRISLDLC